MRRNEARSRPLSMFMKRIILLSLAATSLAPAQLPVNYQLDNDWLLHSSEFKAQINADEQNKTITLSNGLITRTIDTRLGTTIAYKNEMTGESIIRAVEPDGSITIDGTTYPIGGPAGKRNKAFLTEAWLKSMQLRKDALVLTGYQISEPAERLQWKRVRHHAPDVTWPPKGKVLRLDYRFPPISTGPSADHTSQPSDLGRTRIFTDTFDKLDTGKGAWTVHATPSYPRANFSNEGKPGEIYTLPHSSVVADHPIAKDVRLLEATIHTGTDNSTSWGPGIGLVFKNNRVIKFNIRPMGDATMSRPTLGIYDGQRELSRVSGKDKINIEKSITLRARLDEGSLYFDARQDGKVWKHYRKVTIPADWGMPILFRVGKLAKDGGLSDAANATNPSSLPKPIRLRVQRVAFYSAFDSKKATAINTQPDALKNLKLSVYYELYDGIPGLSKWITLTNNTPKPINVDKFAAETLSVVEYTNTVEQRQGVVIEPPRVLHLETDMAFGGFTHRNANSHTIHWLADPEYETQVNWSKKSPCFLKVSPTFGPDQTIKPKATFETFRVFELVYDSEDRERRGLSLRRLYRTVAPWVTENPLMLHCKSSNEKVIKNAIDQAQATGFEMVILSFGSGFNAENDHPDYLKKWKNINDYAMKKGIHLGSYSLYSSRSAGKGNDIVAPTGMKVIHGRCPAITSPWGQTYIKKLYNLFEKTNFLVFENDGTYPGSVDITARPPLQKGITDSRWVHWKIWTDFYKYLRSKGVYMNLPDYYFLSGSNKCGMGYREVNWSLPRAEQRIHTRQNIFDGTWDKTPSMGWMFVPLTQYHGGGAAATIEPLNQHLPHYRMMMMSNLGLGIQACYRGTRLYDTPETLRMVKSTVDWFKKHRTILESDLIHGRRADGLDLDWMLHVNPSRPSKERALLSIYNPTDHAITKEIQVPLYYAGLENTAMVQVGDTPAKTITLDQHARTKLKITVPAQGVTTAIFKAK